MAMEGCHCVLQKMTGVQTVISYSICFVLVLLIPMLLRCCSSAICGGMDTRRIVRQEAIKIAKKAVVEGEPLTQIVKEELEDLSLEMTKNMLRKYCPHRSEEEICLFLAEGLWKYGSGSGDAKEQEVADTLVRLHKENIHTDL